MRHRHGFFFVFGFGLLTAGCTTTTNSTPGSSGTGGATAADTDRCKQSCDKMKFFGCSSADAQASCYADCGSATPAQIETFVGCAENSICDPECRTSVQPKEKAAAGGGGATAATCTTACDKLVSCSLIPVGAKSECNAQCAEKGYQYQIDCVNGTACESIAKVCGGIGESSSSSTSSSSGSSGTSEDPSASCLAECDSINFFDCASVAEHSSCRDACTSASSSARATFTSCSKSSGVQCDRKKACLDAFLK